MHKLTRYELGAFLFKCAMFFAFLLSLNPYFLWSIGNYGYIVCFLFLGSVHLCSPKLFMFEKQSVILQVVLLLIIQLHLKSVNHVNIFGYILGFIDWYILSRLLLVNSYLKKETIIFISKILAVICLLSLVGFVLFIFGVHFSPYNTDFNDGQYEYMNYTLFLLDYRSIMESIPRFHGIFLEPAHIGVASTMLLTALSFDFSKWYTKILLITVLATFSLASYGLLIFGLFAQYRTKVKMAFKYIFLLSGALVFSYFVAVNYNDGDNMVNNLIIDRLEFEDGEMVGDNRVGDDFKADYDSFLTTDKIWLGTEFDPNKYETGNAGYRVFIYNNGLISLFFILCFYLLCLNGCSSKYSIPLFFMYAIIFWKGGTPLWYNLIIPYICGLSMLPMFNVKSNS